MDKFYIELLSFHRMDDDPFFFCSCSIATLGIWNHRDVPAGYRTIMQSIQHFSHRPVHFAPHHSFLRISFVVTIH